LRCAAAFFAVAVLLHNGDHVRRGSGSSPTDVFVLGMVAILVEVGLVVLIFSGHRFAPLASAVGGFALAAGYIEVHFLPAHSVLSDSFTSGADVSVLSWMAASVETLAALVLGAVGLAVLRRRGGLSSAVRPVESRSMLEAVRQPVPFALVAVTAIGVVVAIGQVVTG
jgi:hypothetical protein